MYDMAGILMARSIFLLLVKGTQHERHALNTRTIFGRHDGTKSFLRKNFQKLTTNLPSHQISKSCVFQQCCPCLRHVPVFVVQTRSEQKNKLVSLKKINWQQQRSSEISSTRNKFQLNVALNTPRLFLVCKCSVYALLLEIVTAPVACH